MRICLAQLHIDWEDKQSNKNRIRDCLKRLKAVEEKGNISAQRDMGDTLLLLPEMSLTGFSMHTEITAERDRASVRYFERLATEYGVNIGLGWVHAGRQADKGEQKCENHYSVIAPVRGEISDYVKIHPFSYSGEDRFFLGGDRLSVCRMKDMSIGFAICYDLRFPEIFQVLSKEADMIAVPANWPAKRSGHWLTLLRARAIENQCFVAGINCCGMMDGQYYSGDSCLYGPDGAFLVPDYDIGLDTAVPEERLLIYDIENTVPEVRDSFPTKQDRRSELYGNLEVYYGA